MPDSDLFARIESSFRRQSLLATLGARLRSVESGIVEIELPNAPHVLQQHGFVHAGAITSIADSACGYACLTKMSDTDAVLSVEFKINLLAPAKGDSFLARGSVVKMGRTIGVATAEVFAHVNNDPPVVIAVMQATMIRVTPPAGQTG